MMSTPGRGLIQVTGRYNYTNYIVNFKNALLSDAVISKLGNDVNWACDSAGWFWTKGNPANVNLNNYTDQDTANANDLDIAINISNVINKWDVGAIVRRTTRTKLAKIVLLG